jgi:hypothetical protein
MSLFLFLSNGNGFRIRIYAVQTLSVSTTPSTGELQKVIKIIRKIKLKPD